MSIRKIGIIGAGHVGSHGGYALISQGLAEEIVYIDIDEKKAAAQALDLQDSSTYLGRAVHVKAGTYDDIKDAGILIVAAGPLPDMAAGQTDRQQTLGATVEIIKVLYRGANILILDPSLALQLTTDSTKKSCCSLGLSVRTMTGTTVSSNDAPPCVSTSAFLLPLNRS